MATFYFFDDPEVPLKYYSVTKFIGILAPPYESKTTPGKYLKFARADRAEGSDRGLVNSFSNVKKAIHLQVDLVLQQYALLKTCQSKRMNFPGRVELIDELGLLPVGILRNLNLERNRLEHEYEVPEARRVDEALDVAQYLLLASDRILERTPAEFVCAFRHFRGHYLAQIEPLLGEMRLYRITAKGKYGRHGKITYLKAPLRSLADFSISPGVSVAEKPFRVVRVVPANKETWLPIFRILIDGQKSDRLYEHAQVDGKGFLTFSVTVPLRDLEERALHQAMLTRWREFNSPNTESAADSNGNHNK